MLHSGHGAPPPAPEELDVEVEPEDEPPAPPVFPLLEVDVLPELEEMNIPPSPDDEVTLLELLLLEEFGGMLTVPYSSRQETVKRPIDPTTRAMLVAYLRFFMA